MAPVVPFPRPLYPPSHEKGAVPAGVDIVGVKRAIARAGFFPWQDFDDLYSENFAMKGVKPFQKAKGIQATGNYGQATHDALRNTRRKEHLTEWAFDRISIALMKEAAVEPTRPTLPPLGPICSGDPSVLNMDLTHATSGIKLYPAFDTAFGPAGRIVLAPEAITVRRNSSADPGAAFYADGVSGLRYWFGHLQSAPKLGTKFSKGQQIGKTVNQQGVEHCHFAINVEKLWGIGMQFIHHTNYTHGAPKIGVQLAAKMV